MKTQGFGFSFTPLPGSFSPFLHSTMRYRSLRVFSLGGWSPLLPTGFPVSRGTLVQPCSFMISPTRLSRPLGEFPKLLRLSFRMRYGCPQPRRACTAVWAHSRSLAATWEIDLSFFSSAYLDVSVQRVPDHNLWIQLWTTKVFLVRFPHSEIYGSMDICSYP